MDKQLSELRSEIEALKKRIANLEKQSEADKLPTRYEQRLIDQYGEYVDKTKAAQILGVTRATVYTMLEDGRIEGACECRKIKVRSIARYIENGNGYSRRRKERA